MSLHLEHDVSAPMYNVLLPPPQIGLTKDTLFVDIFDNTTIDKIALFVSESSLKRDKGSEGETPNH